MLQEILSHKQKEVQRARQRLPMKVLEERLEDLSPPHSLLQAIGNEKGPKHRIIAEIKRASPSKGVLRADLDPGPLSERYRRAGAVALSVLTDERFFHGSLDHLREVRRRVDLPLLRKDFILDPYQIYEGRLYGADAVLLIVRALHPDQLKPLLKVVLSLGMEALVEIHGEEELTVALEAGARIIGINNRDLATFQVDLSTTERLMPRIPKDVFVVSASGIQTREQVDLLESKGVKAFLVGEALVTAPDPEEKLRELVK